MSGNRYSRAGENILKQDTRIDVDPAFLSMEMDNDPVDSSSVLSSYSVSNHRYSHHFLTHG